MKVPTTSPSHREWTKQLEALRREADEIAQRIEFADNETPEDDEGDTEGGGE